LLDRECDKEIYKLYHNLTKDVGKLRIHLINVIILSYLWHLIINNGIEFSFGAGTSMQHLSDV
jgi:hypothetical protein